jgi:hypothetical protein
MRSMQVWVLPLAGGAIKRSAGKGKLLDNVRGENQQFFCLVDSNANATVDFHDSFQLLPLRHGPPALPSTIIVVNYSEYSVH